MFRYYKNILKDLSKLSINPDKKFKSKTRTICFLVSITGFAKASNVKKTQDA